MTQIWPVLGEAPVPTLVSMIFRPDGVVMVVPAVWAAAGAKRAAVKGDGGAGDGGSEGDSDGNT